MVASTAAFPDFAEAATPRGSEGVRVGVGRDGSPITTTIASTPEAGIVYRSVDMYDFLPFNPSALKTWGGNGVYSAGTATTLRASIDVPPGALVHDVEYYVYNNSGGSAVADTYLYVPGSGAISSINATSLIPGSTPHIAATRVVVPETTHGPYPSGARLLVSVQTPADASVQINGARVGYRHAEGSVGLLQSPVKVVSLKLVRGHVHTVTLPAFLNAPGVVGVQASMVAHSVTKAGTVKAWATGTPRPSQPVLYFPAHGAGVAESVALPVSATGTFQMVSSQTVHLTVMAYEALS